MNTNQTRFNQLPTLLAMVSLSLALFATPASAGLNVYAELNINGEAIDGDTTINDIAGLDVSVDHIEIHAFNHEAFVAIDGSGRPTGRATHAPIKLVRPVGKASPFFLKALNNNERVDGTFKFFRENSDIGATEHYYSITVAQARIVGVRSWSPNNLDPAAATYPFMEEISIIYSTITFTDEINETQYQIEVNGEQ